MVSTSTLWFVCLMFNILVTLVSAQKSFLYEYCENEKGNFTTNSTYQTNLKYVLSILPSTAGNGNGFSSVSLRNFSDEVYAIGLCRGDVEPHVCRSCLNQSTQLLTQTCPNQKEAIGWFDECMLRYSNRSLIGLMETHPKFHSWSTQNSSFIDMDSFSQDVKTLLENLKNRAAAGGSLRKYAAGNASVLDQFQTLYAFAQCTPDLSQLDCNNCLDEAFEDFQQHNRSVGGRVFTPSCNFRYKVYPFDGHDYDTPPASRPQSEPLLPPAMAASKRKKSGVVSIVASVVLIIISFGVVLIISFGVHYLRVKKNMANGQKVEGTSPAPSNDEQQRSTMENGGESRRTLKWKKPLRRVLFLYYDKLSMIVHKRQDLSSNEAAEIERATHCKQFEISTIRAATDDFSAENMIAKTAFGCLYKGWLSDGQDIAVKSFDKHPYFLNEILFGAKLQHRNIVRLLGFCLKGDDQKRSFLVYKLLPTPLDRLIFVEDNQTCLDWGTRYSIIRGIAGGLLYLHEDYHSTIIHRDIKASNILLDENMNPRITGFELALLSSVDQNTEFQAPAETLGYVGPAYAETGNVTTKSDVFSFGVLLLEIVTGQGCTEHLQFQEHSKLLPRRVKRNYMEGTILNVVDPKITDVFNPQIMRCIHIGLLCTEMQEDARPTMRSVVQMLDCHAVPLPLLSPDINGFVPEVGSSSSSDRFMSQVTESDDHSIPTGSEIISSSEITLDMN